MGCQAFYSLLVAHRPTRWARPEVSVRPGRIGERDPA